MVLVLAPFNLSVDLSISMMECRCVKHILNKGRLGVNHKCKIVFFAAVRVAIKNAQSEMDIPSVEVSFRRISCNHWESTSFQN